jgi:MFS family permease
VTPPGRIPQARYFSRLLAAVAASALGTGMTMPYLASYLTGERGFTLRTAGLLISVGGALGLAVISAAGRLMDRGAGGYVLPGVTCLCAAGSTCLAIARQPWTAAAGVVLLTMAAAAIWPCVAALIGRLAAADGLDPTTWFTREYAALNVGIGAGSLAGGLILRGLPADGYHLVFGLDAASYVAFAALCLTIRIPPAAIGTKPATSTNPLRDRSMRVLAGTMLVLVVVGYGQLETVLPAILRTATGVGSTVIGLAFLVNTMVVFGAQRAIPRVSRHWDARRRLAAVGPIWAAALGMLAVAAAAGPLLAAVLILLAFAGFAAGESLQSGSAPTLLDDIAPAEARGRYAAMFGTAWQTGMVLAPLLGAFLASAGGTARSAAWSYFAVLAAVALIAPAAALAVPKPDRPEPGPAIPAPSVLAKKAS